MNPPSVPDEQVIHLLGILERESCVVYGGGGMGWEVTILDKTQKN